MAAQTAPEGTVIEMPDGSQRVKRGGQWVPVGGYDTTAPGAAFMTSDATAPKITADVQKYLMDQRKAARTTASAAADARRFVDLNKDVGTGGLDDWGPIGVVTSMMDPKKSEMRALSERMVPAQREVGSGPMSDKDVDMYRAATLAIDKPGPTNQALAGVLEAGGRRQSDYASFLDFYIQRRGSLLGSEEAWASYAEANPLFEAGKTGTIVRKTTPWRQWFGAEAQGQPQAAATARPATAPARPVTGIAGQSTVKPDFGAMSPAQRRAAGRFRGTKAPSGTQENPSIPVSEAQYNALPKGTVWLDQDGTPRIKR
jgi:hypothetical protein